jgi:hypothetical protein
VVDMNDFTKEELNMMADGIVLIKKRCSVSNDTKLKLDDLDEKLCSMINNYFELKIPTVADYE